MSEAAALQPAPGAGAGDLLLRLADILSGRREGGLSFDEAEALAPRTAYAPEDMADRLLPLAMRRT